MIHVICNLQGLGQRQGHQGDRDLSHFNPSIDGAALCSLLDEVQVPTHSLLDRSV